MENEDAKRIDPDQFAIPVLHTEFESTFTVRSNFIMATVSSCARIICSSSLASTSGEGETMGKQCVTCSVSPTAKPNS